MPSLAARLQLLPADHVRMLHPAGQRAIVTIAQGGCNWHERPVPVAQLAAHIADTGGATDLFVSQQSFWGWRRIAQLAELDAAYVDLDYHHTEKWADLLPEAVTDFVLETLAEQRVPAPSYVLSTGRGLLVVWLHGLVRRNALPRWMAIQKRLRSPRLVRRGSARPRCRTGVSHCRNGEQQVRLVGPADFRGSSAGADVPVGF